MFETSKAVFFDLDGTLLPMDEKEFVHIYFSDLTKVTLKYGLDPKKVIDAMWLGVAAMVKNDTESTNEEVFWDVFFKEFSLSEEEKESLKKDLDKFYETEFFNSKSATRENPYAKPLLETLRNKGKKIILATNPIFPLVAVKSRLAFIGLTTDDFDYVTSFENSISAKPNPSYYQSLLTKLNLKPEEVLMVGNDVKEDILASKPLGIRSILITDSMIGNPDEIDVPKMSFKELIENL